MANATGSEQRRTLGPALASAVVGALLGGALIFGIAAVSQDSEIPEAQAVSTEDALMGGVEYGER